MPLVATVSLLEFRPACANTLVSTLAPLLGKFIRVLMSRRFIRQPALVGLTGKGKKPTPSRGSEILRTTVNLIV